FIVQDDATIKNSILAEAQAEGNHCRGPCTPENVWWEDVCEDAAMFKQPTGDADKPFQFNDRGTVSIRNFFAEDCRKEILSNCGDCTANGGPRNIIIEGVTARDGGVLCGINTNYGDTCNIINSCQSNTRSCDRYKGIVKGNGN
ncbi:polysaccharide lyase family 3 protein, partial [Didymella exigua CBS 183.55]